MSMLRQQMKPSCRIHAIISDGGQKPNIIPQKSQLKCYVRAPDDSERDALKQKVIACAEGAAKATGRRIVQIYFFLQFYDKDTGDECLGLLFSQL